MGIISKIKNAIFGDFPKRRTNQESNFRLIRSFSAARVSSHLDDWLKIQIDINEELKGDLDSMRERSRHLVKNSDYAARYKSLMELNVIGPNGIILQSKATNRYGKYDKKLSNYVEEKFKDWQKNYADERGVQHFVEMCKTMVGGLVSDGEFLVNLVKNRAGNPYGLSLQIVDVARIDTNKNSSSPANIILAGIGINNYGRPNRIYLRSEKSLGWFKHSKNNYGGDSDSLELKNVLHCFKLQFADQLRGIPLMASGVLTLHHLSGYIFSAILAAQNGANNYGFFTKQTQLPYDESPEDKDLEEEQRNILNTIGTYISLTPGRDVKQLDSKYPAETFGIFVKSILQKVASGFGISYSSLTGDLEAVNYSSIRSGVLQERERWVEEQNWFIRTFLDKVYDNWLRLSYENGIFDKFFKGNRDEETFSRLLGREWQPRRWDWVDPKNDAEAKIALVKAGVLPLSALSSSMGYDYTDNIDQLAEIKKLSEEKGLTLTIFDKKEDKSIIKVENEEERKL